MALSRGNSMAIGVVGGGSVAVPWTPPRWHRQSVRLRIATAAAVGVALLTPITGIQPWSILGAGDGPAASTTDTLTAADEASIASQIEAAELYFHPRPDGSFAVVNADAGISATLSEGALAVRGLEAARDVTLSTTGFGRPGHLVPLATAVPAATDLTATVAHGPVTEWFRNREGGLEQGWTIPQRPAGPGGLVLDLGVSGAAVEVIGSRSAQFVQGDSVLSYNGLAVHDAAGTVLPARFRETATGLRVLVDDTGASYPVVIDPVLSSVETVEARPNATMDQFGHDVDVSGRWLVVGATSDRLTATQTGRGSVSLFYDQTGAGDWKRIGLLPDPVALTGGPAIGISVAIDTEPGGVTIVAGASNANRAVLWTIPGDPDVEKTISEVTLPQIITPQTWVNRPASGYGWSVDLDDGLLVIGANRAGTDGMFMPDGPDANSTPDAYGELIGLAEVLRRGGGFGSPFVFETRLNPPGGLQETDRALRDSRQEFGHSVTIEGDLVAVGAIGDDGVQTPTAGSSTAPLTPGTSTRKGAVHVFQRVAGTWSLTNTLAGTPRVDAGLFGHSVDLAQGDLLVGEPGAGGATGAAYLYDQGVDGGSGGPSWTVVDRLTGDDPRTAFNEAATANFGYAVDFDPAGLDFVVGAFTSRSGYPGAGNGAMHAFSRAGPGPGDVPVFSKRMHGDSQTSSFGLNVAIDGSTTVAGAQSSSGEGGNNPGAAFIFEGGEGFDWAKKLTPVGDRFNQTFGQLIDQDGDVLAVLAATDRRLQGSAIGAGSVHLFRRVNGAWQFDRMVWPDAGNQIIAADADWGGSLALHVRRDANGNETGLWIAVGAPGDSSIDLDGRGDPQFGQTVATHAGTVAVYGRVGAPTAPWSQWSTELWSGGHQGINLGRPPQFNVADLTAEGRFGSSVAFTADGTLIVGEPGVDQIHRYDMSGQSDAFSPSFTHRETIVGDGNELGKAVSADGTRVVVAGVADNSFVRINSFIDGDPNTNLTPEAAYNIGLPGGGPVALDLVGQRLAIGASDADAARVYRLIADGGGAALEAHLDGQADSQYGAAVALNHGGAHLTLVVGATDRHGDFTEGEATAYIASVTTDGRATWSEAATLAPPQEPESVPVQHLDRSFGAAVSNWPDQGGVLVGAPGNDWPDTNSGRAYAFATSALSPPSGPTAFVDVSTPGEVPVGATYIPTDGLAPSLLSNNTQQAGSIAAASIGGIDLTLPPEGANVAASPLSTIPLTPLLDSASQAITSIRLSDLGLTLPGGWPALLEGTPFEGVPLQSISLKDVANLPAVRQLTWADISVAASPLSTIPLSTIALGAVPLSTIPLGGDGTSIEQWCEQLNAAGFDSSRAGLDCDNPGASANGDVTIVSLALAGAPLSTIPLSTIPLSTIPLSTIPLSTIPLSTIDLAGSPLSTIPLSTIPLSTIPLSTIPLSTIPLSTIPLSTIPLSTIDLAGSPLSTIPLSTIDLAGSPLSTIPLSTIPLSTIPLSTIPLSTIPLSTIPLSTIPLSTIDLAGSPLSTIPLSTIDLAGSPLSTIPLSTIPLSTIPLSTIPLSTIPLSTIPLSTIPLSTIDLAGSPLSTIPLSTIDLAGSPLSTIPLSTIPLSTIGDVVDCDLVDCDDPRVTLGDATRAGALVDGGTLGGLEGALSGIHYGDLLAALTGYSVDDFREALTGLTLADFDNFDDLALGDLPQIWAYLTLGDLGDGLKGFRLGDIANRIDGFTADDVRDALGARTLADLTDFDDLTLGELVVLHEFLTFGDLDGLLTTIRLGDLAGIISKSGGGTYSAADLRAALTQAMGASATLDDLGPDFDDLTLGELAEYGATTIGQLLGALEEEVLERITLGDLLLTLIARSQYPWEDLNLDNALSQSLDENEQSVPVSVAIEAQAPDGHARDVRVVVRPPDGSVMVPGSATLTLPGHADELEPAIVDGALVWTFTSLPAGAVHTLAFSLEPTVRIGVNELKATATLLADDVSASDTAGLTVAEALEPNDTPADAAVLPADTIVLSHISTGSDIDLFKFPVSQAGTRISLILSNLDADLDLTLYGPTASSAAIQAPSDRSIVPVEDEDAGAVPDNDETAPIPDDDIAAPSGLGDLSVHARSIHRRTHDEQIDATLSMTGTYYLAVSGYNGATNRDPYALRLKKLGSTNLGSCPTRSVTEDPVSGSLPAQLPAGTNTFFLLNQSRLGGLYGSAEAGAVRNGLDDLVAYLNSHAGLGVKATVLPVDADAGVRAAYTAWDSAPCDPNQANGVAGEIVRVLDSYRDDGAELKHIVVVGGDDVVPFARVPDKTEIANERGYATTFSEARTALASSHAGGFVQTDDAYGDVDPYGFGDRVLFVTDAAVGRLVETPDEITDQLDDFVAAGGKLGVDTGLVTGYDFLSDGADAAADAADPTYGDIDRSLISDAWTRGDLEAAIADIQPDLAGINAHFDHFRALPGLGNSTGDESDLFTAAAVRGALDGDLAGSIVFSMGCHSGLSASDLLVSGDRALDFAQAVSAQGGVFVGNTGYGYGDTELVALSERLMAGFARRLDGSLSVGEALQYAKAEYAADLTAYGVYDEKALMEATFYGLPFYRLDVANPPPVPPLPPTPAISTDPISGIDTSTIEVTPITEERAGEDGSTYFVGIGEDDEVLSTEVHDRPVQPRAEESFTAPAGTEAHDALVHGLTTTDLHGIEPHLLEPIVDNGGERTGAAADVAFPSSPVRVNPELTPAGKTFTMTATTGYFRTTAADGSGIQRLVDEMSVTPYFVDDANDDFTRATFRRVDATVADGTLTLAADVVDDQGGPERIKRVLVLVLVDPEHGSSSTWQSVDLVRTEGSRWTGSIPVSGDEIEYVVQAVDAAGNVAVTANKALNFRDEALVTAPPAPTLRLKLTGDEGNAGWYTGPVTFTATGGSNLTYEVVGESDEAPYSGPVTVSSEGPHTVIVRSGDGQEVARMVRIDTTGPVAVAVAPTDDAVLARDGGASAQFVCLDAGSGATSCDATLTVRTGYGNGAGTTAPIEQGADVSGADGRHTLTVTAGTDVAGNAPEEATDSASFAVVVPPRINTLSLPGSHSGTTRSVGVDWTGVPIAGPYTTLWAWGDGTTTTCTTGQTTASCSSSIAANGAGTSLATHTYPTNVERDAQVTVTDSIGQQAIAAISFNKTTVMVAKPALVTLNLLSLVIAPGGVGATLKTPSGVPIVGRTITFTAGNGAALCTATTGADGKAACGRLIISLAAFLSGSYTATFAGDSTYKGVNTTAQMLKLL